VRNGSSCVMRSFFPLEALNSRRGREEEIFPDEHPQGFDSLVHAWSDKRVCKGGYYIFYSGALLFHSGRQHTSLIYLFSRGGSRACLWLLSTAASGVMTLPQTRYAVDQRARERL
jgi:hypothetical protein